jgi:hypothetical protein
MRSGHRVCLNLEELERREVPTVYTVTGVGDTTGRDGVVTLREALLAAENHRVVGDAAAGTAENTIRFAIPGNGVHTIYLHSALPALTGHITIDGTTQPGYTGTPVVALDGSAAGLKVDGLVLRGGYNTVRGLIIDHFRGDGVEVLSDHNTLAGDVIGLDGTGIYAAGNVGDGVFVTGGYNTIGGTGTHDRVVISGNHGAGVELVGYAAVGNRIMGDTIGTDAQGFAAVANSYGILLRAGANHNVIGGTAHAQRNVISGNALDEIRLTGTGTSANMIQGNFIGVDASGKAASLSGYDGIRLDGGTTGNLIGGVIAGSGNLISGAGHLSLANGLQVGVGVEILGTTTAGNTIQGNWIGVNSAGLAPLSNLAGGILLRSAGKNTIGGNSKAAYNLIADQTNSPGLATTNQILAKDWYIHSIEFLMHPELLDGSFKA